MCACSKSFQRTIAIFALKNLFTLYTMESQRKGANQNNIWSTIVFFLPLQTLADYFFHCLFIMTKKLKRAEWLVRPDKTPVPEQTPSFFNGLSRTILNVENDRLAGIKCFIITTIWRSMGWEMQLEIINPFDPDPNIFLDALASLGKSICLSVDLFKDLYQIAPTVSKQKYSDILRYQIFFDIL